MQAVLRMHIWDVLPGGGWARIQEIEQGPTLPSQEASPKDPKP